LKGLAADEAAARFAQLYGDLDHAHGFHEGNSRTLREFTRELADAAGYTLDWTRVGTDAEARNALYVARDIEVLQREYPDLTEERAMATRPRGVRGMVSFGETSETTGWKISHGDHPRWHRSGPRGF
jgi:fido (protein-threonine AMPylation protein)